jgi:hypothetical protein
MMLPATTKKRGPPHRFAAKEHAMELTDDEFRTGLRNVLARSGLSMRGLSGGMGRDPGYIAASLDPSRPSRARPTPADLLRASDATGIPFVELLETLWGIDPNRLVDELRSLGVVSPKAARGSGLSDADRAVVAEFADFLASRRARRLRQPRAGQ